MMCSVCGRRFVIPWFGVRGGLDGHIQWEPARWFLLVLHRHIWSISHRVDAISTKWGLFEPPVWEVEGWDWSIPLVSGALKHGVQCAVFDDILSVFSEPQAAEP